MFTTNLEIQRVQCRQLAARLQKETHQRSSLVKVGSAPLALLKGIVAKINFTPLRAQQQFYVGTAFE